MTPRLNFCVLLVLASCLTACHPTTECGTWAFSGTPNTDPGYAQFPDTSTFTFHPDSCGKNCSCDTNCMIQMVSVYNSEDESYQYPTTSYADRAAAYGWVIDRVDGSAYGYYGLLNDGVTFFNFWNITGSNGQPNTLMDNPSGWGPNTYFYAVDVSVCFTSKTCQNSIQGYYFWSWIVDNSGTPSKFIIAPAWKDLDSTFQTALAAWNTWAPGSGTEDSYMPGQPTLPHAVPFPTLTDL